MKNLEQENKQLKETTSQCIKQAETLESKETLLVEEIHSILTQTQQDFQNVSLELNKSSQDLQRQEEEKGRILRELVDAHRKNKDVSYRQLKVRLFHVPMLSSFKKIHLNDELEQHWWNLAVNNPYKLRLILGSMVFILHARKFLRCIFIDFVKNNYR